MTVSDLMVPIPWIVFAITLTVLCIWLFRLSRR